MSIDRKIVLHAAMTAGFTVTTFNGGAVTKLAPMADIDSLCEVIKAYEAAKAAEQPDGYTLVPNSALRWLFGEEGSFEKPEDAKGNYWWRSRFRKMIGEVNISKRESRGDRNYEAAMYEISEIVRVARDNPNGLKEFLMVNFPKEWGITKKQHKALLSGASTAEIEGEKP